MNALPPIRASHRASLVREIQREQTDAVIIRAFLRLDPEKIVAWAAHNSATSKRDLAEHLERLIDTMAGDDPDNDALSRMADAAGSYFSDMQYACDFQAGAVA